jgi:ATP-dependent DNA helicase RecG
MKFKETETLELKKSTSELKEGVVSIAAILNKHGKGELYFGIKEHINWRADLSGGQRRDIPEIPLRAITEAVVNSLCHRDFFNGKGNEIAVFKNRLEIYNPGRFPDEYSPADFIKGGERSVLRNPAIANALFLASDIERWGSGLKRIYDACHEAGVKVEFQPIKSGFLVILHRRDTSAGDSRKAIEQTTQTVSKAQSNGPVSEQVSEQVLKMLDYCRTPHTKQEILSYLGLALVYLNYKRHISTIVNKGYLEQTIPDKPNSRLKKYRLTEKGRKLIDGKK